MKSICIKVTNQDVIDYLLEKLTNSELQEVYFSCKKFKIYNNIIIHYKGNYEKYFLKIISQILSDLILDLFEESLIKKIIRIEYFYFDKFEQKQIFDNTFDDLNDAEEAVYNKHMRFKILCNCFYIYIETNKSLNLKGFITFRIKKYLQTLLEQIDKSVNKYIIEREYIEFISLLKMYVNSEPSSIDIVYLIYNNNKPTLMDKNKNLIEISDNILNNKYLSDISFSSNDYALNALLNLVPQKIYIYTIDSNCDEFINTIKLIFENRVEFCNNQLFLRLIGTVQSKHLFFYNKCV